MKHLRALVMMQLRDKLDLSFLRSRRKAILKITLGVLEFAAVTAVFFVLFSLSVRLGVFSFVGGLPDTVLAVIFTVIQLMSIVTCTVGLTRTLYMTEDNRVLLTLPVGGNNVFLSKLILYYLFELKKNLAVTVPAFLAYGLVNGAVWYYYPWMLVCFLFLSLVPVAIGVILSIPGLFVATLVRRARWLQLTLATIAAAAVAYGIFVLVNALPANINIVGQWGSIFAGIQKFLQTFARIFYPWYRMTLLAVGGTLRITSRLFRLDTLVTFAAVVGVCAVLVGSAFLAAKPLFFRMASKQFEYEKRTARARKNRVHGKTAALVDEELRRNMRDGGIVVRLFVQLLLPPLALFLLNKLYAAMNTSYSGQTMTKAFNILVLLLMTLSFNAEYASAYSRDGLARQLLKTRPVSPVATLLSRLLPRAVVCAASAILAAVLYTLVSEATAALEGTLVALIGVCAGAGHLLWSAELDIMRPQDAQYALLGTDFDNPNERLSTIYAVIVSALFAFLFYFVASGNTVVATAKLLAVAAVFLVGRTVLYVQRAKLYFAEK